MSEEDNDDEAVEIVTVDDAQPSPTSVEDTLAKLNFPDLMRHFQAIVKFSSPDDLLDKVLAASSCLEGKDHIQGSISSDKKAKSLVHRWLAKPIYGMAEGGTTVLYGDILIEMDVVILISVKIGTGANDVTVNCPYCVVDIYYKHFNKWFMSNYMNPNNTSKKWKKEPKSFKLKIRMLHKDALGKYRDVGLCDNSTYDKEIICRIIDENIDGPKIVGVV